MGQTGKRGLPDFQIYYGKDEAYEPDFVVETETRKWLCEPKRANEMTDPEVLAKARADALWCKRATALGDTKPWSYMLVPHDAIRSNMTLDGLASAYIVDSASDSQQLGG